LALLPTILLIACISLSAEAQVRTLAVYPEPTERLENVPTWIIQNELDRLLLPAGIDVRWQPPRDKESELLVVGSFLGHCSVEDISAAFATRSSTKRTLAEVRVSASGRILPFVTVDCPRLIRTLAPVLESLSIPLRNVIFGRALARILAHEIFHVVAQTANHSDSGVAKASLSREELMAERFDFDSVSLAWMHPVARLSAVLPPR
jgi:hypothetical protein